MVLKAKIEAPYVEDKVDGVLPYESMDKGDHVDESGLMVINYQKEETKLLLHLISIEMT